MIYSWKILPIQKTCMTPTKVWKEMLETYLEWESVQVHLKRIMWQLAFVEGAQELLILLLTHI